MPKRSDPAAAPDAWPGERPATGEAAGMRRADALALRLAGTGRPLVLDGATGTELERLGLSTGLPLWSTHALLEAPECVLQVHAAHLAAGAEIVTANTFRTQQRTLARAGLDAATPGSDVRLTRLAIGLARSALDPVGPLAPPGRWVAGSLPPLEDCYRPDLVPSDAALDREHGRQAELLGEAGADLILIETMNTAREARAAARAAARTGLPFAVAFVAWDGARLLSGEALAEAAREVVGLGAAAVGVNCLPAGNLPACRQALRALGAPLLVSPNRGRPEPRSGFAREPAGEPHAFVGALEPWLESGGRTAIVGGCCGTTPADIAALARRITAR